MSTGITAILEVDEATFPKIKGSIAAVSRTTGQMFLNMPMIQQLKAAGVIDKEGEVLTFIMLHEAGHVALDTSDEKAVDDWAFWQYVNSGNPLSCFAWGVNCGSRSLKKSIYALTRILKFEKAEDFERATLQLERALKFDNK